MTTTTTLQSLPQEIAQHLEASGQLGSANFAGEQPGNLRKALPRATDIVLSNLSELAGSPEGREQVWQLAKEAAEAPPAANEVGAGLVKTALVDRLHGTVHGIVSAAGVQPASVTKLLDVITASALALMGGLVAEHGWDAEQLAQWLRPHRTEPVAAADTPAPAPALLADTPAGASWFANRTNLLLLAISLIAVGELGYILGQHSVAADATVATTTTAGSSAGTVSTDAGTSRPAGGRAYTAIPIANLTAGKAANPATVPVPVVLKLKDGVRQVIGAASTESKLYQFLVDPSKEVDAQDPTKDWIGFDRIYFDPNKATLTNESLWQLSNVASILKRFPESKIKLGGYTDNTGKPFTNLQLSKGRAQAALDALVSMGVPAARLTAVGYGQLDNIASNDTEEGRAVNRRVSMQVTQK